MEVAILYCWVGDEIDDVLGKLGISEEAEYDEVITEIDEFNKKYNTTIEYREYGDDEVLVWSVIHQSSVDKPVEIYEIPLQLTMEFNLPPPSPRLIIDASEYYNTGQSY